MSFPLLLLSRAPKVHYDLSPQAFLALWLGFAGLIILILWAAIRQGRKRTQAMQQLAMEIGCNFFDKTDESLSSELAGIQMSTGGLGGIRRFRNVLKGAYRGGDLVIADCTTGSGKNSSTFTVLAFKFAEPLPSFAVFPENKLFHLLEKVGLSDIDIPEAPEFSRRFFLRGSDEVAVRKLFTPQITQAFELCSDRAMYATASPNWLTFYHARGTIAVEKLRDFRQQVEPIADAFLQGRSFASHF